MDIILLGVTVISLGVALVMSVAAWRVTSDEKKRSAARVAALSLAASDDARPNAIGFEARTEKPVGKAPWAPQRVAQESAPRVVPPPIAPAVELPLNQPRFEPARVTEPSHLGDSYGGQVSHASGFLGASEVQRDSGSGQKSLAFAAVILFVVLSGGLVWMMSGPEGTSAAAIGPNSPLELVSLSHQRQNDRLAVSGLVRNPVAGKQSSFVVIEHNMDFVMDLCDRLVVLDFGQVIARGTPQQIRQDPAVQKAYLGEKIEAAPQVEHSVGGDHA